MKPGHKDVDYGDLRADLRCSEVTKMMREILGDALIIVLGVLLTLLFILFWISDWITIGEPNKIILSVETAMALGIIALGIERFGDDIRRLRRK